MQRGKAIETMTGIRAIAIVAAMFAICIGLPVSLYLLFTAERRKAIRDIRHAAAGCGWKFGIRRLLGDPTAFRIEGRTGAGMAWILTTEGSSQQSTRWASEMRLRIPGLAGPKDFDISPRDPKDRSSGLVGARLSPRAEARVAAVSGTLADAIEFNALAREIATGAPAFDAAYRVQILPDRFSHSPIDSGLAKQMLEWPGDAIRPVALLVRRDSFGLHLEVRLPAMPNWSTISWLLALAESLSVKLPAQEQDSVPSGFVDRVVNRFL